MTKVVAFTATKPQSSAAKGIDDPTLVLGIQTLAIANPTKDNK
jgi:hypothetical protein